VNSIRVIAIPTSLAEKVRATGKSPGNGHPSHSEIAAGHGPCRHCLRTFNVGEEKRTLFTYDPFHGLENTPLPGPIFIHSETCARYPEDGGYPEQMKQYPTTLAAYAKGRRLMSEVQVETELKSRPSANYSSPRMSPTFMFATKLRDAMTFESSALFANSRTIPARCRALPLSSGCISPPVCHNERLPPPSLSSEETVCAGP